MPTEMIARLPLSQLGGARVFRPCTIGGMKRRGGDEIDANTVAAIPRAALRALIDQRFIVVWPKPSAPAPTASAEVFMYNRLGTSTYDVIQGQRLNDKPLSKADAEALVARHRRPAAA